MDVRRIPLSVNMTKPAGHENISGCVLKTCADQLADGIADVFNISLSQGFYSHLPYHYPGTCSRQCLVYMNA